MSRLLWPALDRILRALLVVGLRGVLLQMKALVWLDDLRSRLPRMLRCWTGSLRRVLRRLFVAPPPPVAFQGTRRRPWNRTPDHIEEQLVRLHVEQPLLGTGGLGRLARRVFAFGASRQTVRKILLRRRALVFALQQERRRRPRRITIRGQRLLWGMDLTLVWLLGFIPVWILGVVDYHGSRVIALQRVRWPTSLAVARVLTETFKAHGPPARMLTDNASIFCSQPFKEFLAQNNVRHSRIKPAHAWTNGRIERLFRTFKETVGHFAWVFTSTRRIDRWCADFQRFYNRDRPHSSYGGLTPDEIAAGITVPAPVQGRVSYFDGRLKWYAFG